MEHGQTRVKILMVDDDADDCFLVNEALRASDLDHELQTLPDGVELLDYLYRRGQYEDLTGALPDLILLDLNMPRKDGREVLYELRQDPSLRNIPIAVLTGSSEWCDISRCYELGATVVFNKSEWFQDLINIITICGNYWFKWMTWKIHQSAHPNPKSH
jgi:CheY-like chemotaxis protein